MPRSKDKSLAFAIRTVHWISKRLESFLQLAKILRGWISEADDGCGDNMRRQNGFSSSSGLHYYLWPLQNDMNFRLQCLLPPLSIHSSGCQFYYS